MPVIYLTGLTHPDEEIRGLGLGAADFITKPCAKDVLLARVESRLRSAKRLDMEKLSKLPEKLTDTELATGGMSKCSYWIDVFVVAEWQNINMCSIKDITLG